MKPTPQAIENAARALCKWDGYSPDTVIPYEQGPDNRLLRSQPKDGPKIWPEMPYWQFRYAAQAERILSIDLGDMVLVPKEPTEAMLEAAVVAGHQANKPFVERIKSRSFEAGMSSDITAGDGRIYRAAYRAMIAAAEDSNDKG